MIHLIVVWLLVAVLAGLGIYGVLARRNAVMVLIGAELLLNAAVLLMVTTDLTRDRTDSLLAGQSAGLFVITIAAAEIGLGLAVVMLLFRTTGSVDLRAADPDEAPAPDPDTASLDGATGLLAGSSEKSET